MAEKKNLFQKAKEERDNSLATDILSVGKEPEQNSLETNNIVTETEVNKTDQVEVKNEQIKEVNVDTKVKEEPKVEEKQDDFLGALDSIIKKKVKKEKGSTRSFYLKDSIYEGIVKMAKNVDKTPSQFVEDILEEIVNRYHKK